MRDGSKYSRSNIRTSCSRFALLPVFADEAEEGADDDDDEEAVTNAVVVVDVGDVAAAVVDAVEDDEEDEAVVTTALDAKIVDKLISNRGNSCRCLQSAYEIQTHNQLTMTMMIVMMIAMMDDRNGITMTYRRSHRRAPRSTTTHSFVLQSNRFWRKGRI